MVYKDDEIKRLVKEERHRGKKTSPPLTEAVARRNLERLRVVENLLAERHYSRFIRRLTESGLETDSVEYQMAVAAWLDHWRTALFSFSICFLASLAGIFPKCLASASNNRSLGDLIFLPFVFTIF